MPMTAFASINLGSSIVREKSVDTTEYHTKECVYIIATAILTSVKHLNLTETIETNESSFSECV